MFKPITLKKIFLIDALGAFFSFFTLLFIFNFFGNLITLPRNSVIALLVIVFCFTVYSFSCFFIAKHQFVILLKIIAFFNIGYCILIGIICLAKLQGLTNFEKIYFPFEIMIIFILSLWEIKIAKNHNLN